MQPLAIGTYSLDGFGSKAELCAYLVYDGPRAACAFVVHGGDLNFFSALFVESPEDYLRILPPYLYDRTCIWMQMFNGKRDCIYLLDKPCSYERCKRATSTAGNKGPRVARRNVEFFVNGNEEVEKGFRLSCLMAPVILPEDFIPQAVHNHNLYSCGTDVNAQYDLTLR